MLISKQKFRKNNVIDVYLCRNRSYKKQTVCLMKTLSLLACIHLIYCTIMCNHTYISKNSFLLFLFFAPFFSLHTNPLAHISLLFYYNKDHFIGIEIIYQIVCIIVFRFYSLIFHVACYVFVCPGVCCLFVSFNMNDTTRCKQRHVFLLQERFYRCVNVIPR